MFCRPSILPICLILCAVFVPAVSAQAPAGQSPTMKQLMLDLIHPASNDILLAAYRGGPADAKEWDTVRHSALALTEAANQLMAPALARSSAGGNQETWIKAAKMLADAAADSYKAAQAKDARALPAITIRIDASCTTCHKQFRPNVFPKEGGTP